MLSERISGCGRGSLWEAIRHYLGRLSSWHRASVILTTTAQNLPGRIRDARVCAVPHREEKGERQPNGNEDIEDALRRLCPIDSPTLARARTTLRSRVGEEVAVTFRSLMKHKLSKPCVHAELLVLEHVYRRRCTFIGDDRYIGCSKPSCYCCSVYLSLHPAKALPRPCHGNAWVRWSPPLRSGRHDGDRSSGARLLQQVADEMGRALLTGFSADSSVVFCQPESTTGMSLVP